MITFKNLNWMGRFGNQLFQYALVRTIAEKNSYEFGVPDWIGRKIYIDLEKDLYPSEEEIPQYKEDFEWKPTAMEYDRDLFSIEDNTDLMGFFQCYQYYLPYQKKINEYFRLTPELQNQVDDVLKNLALINKFKIGIQIRQGDYARQGPQTFPILTASYYIEAVFRILKELNVQLKDCHFVISSDEPKERILAQYSPIFGKENITFLEEQPHITMAIMSNLRSLVMSNSTFSWWTAFLMSPDSIITFPDNWVGLNFTYPMNIKCPNWITIPIHEYVDKFSYFILRQKDAE